MKIHQLIKGPVITEKSTRLAAEGKYVFKVVAQARKPAIAKAVKDSFGVKVVDVKTLIMPGKTKRTGRGRKLTKTAGWKKAIVVLSRGEKIELLEMS